MNYNDFFLVLFLDILTSDSCEADTEKRLDNHFDFRSDNLAKELTSDKNSEKLFFVGDLK